MEVIDKVKKISGPIADERRYYVVDVTYKLESGKLVLRVLLDKVGGITMEECARFNNKLSEFLDKENIIEDQYILEVSSPGLDRKLKRSEDFVWAVGKKVRVTTYAPLDGKNLFQGVLLGLGEGTVVIGENGTSTEIPREKIANARLESDIDESRV